jgi:hypothetical protein
MNSSIRAAIAAIPGDA